MIVQWKIEKELHSKPTFAERSLSLYVNISPDHRLIPAWRSDLVDRYANLSRDKVDLL